MKRVPGLVRSINPSPYRINPVLWNGKFKRKSISSALCCSIITDSRSAGNAFPTDRTGIINNRTSVIGIYGTVLCFYKISKRFVLRRNKECCGYGNKRSKSQKFYKFCHFYYLFSVNLQSNLFRAIHSHPAYLLRFFATTIAAVPPITRATADKIAGSEVSAFPESEEPESEEDAALPSLIRK